MCDKSSANLIQGLEQVGALGFEKDPLVPFQLNANTIGSNKCQWVVKLLIAALIGFDQVVLLLQNVERRGVRLNLPVA